jgi:hypothetical protein
MPGDTMIERLHPGRLISQDRYAVHFSIDFGCEQKTTIFHSRVSKQMTAGCLDYPAFGCKVVVAINPSGPQSTVIGRSHLPCLWRFSG